MPIDGSQVRRIVIVPMLRTGVEIRGDLLVLLGRYPTAPGQFAQIRIENAKNRFRVQI
jgi:hypothetical protein